MLDLDFDQEQELLRQTARDVLAAALPARRGARRWRTTRSAIPPALWTQLGELDLIGLLLPEEYGGSGMSLIEGVALYEELGRALAPTPHFVSAVLSGGVLAAAGSEAQKEQWLRPVASGEAIVTPAWLEPENGFSPLGRADDRARADGTGSASTGSSATCCSPRRRTGWWCWPGPVTTPRRSTSSSSTPQASGVTLRQQFSIASDTQYEVTLSDVARRRGRPHRAGRQRLGHLAAGAASRRWCCWARRPSAAPVTRSEITTQYAKDRHQFDKPLGAFQALAHYLADAVTNLDGAEQLVHEAAWAGANGRSLESLAPMAKLFACSTFRDITAMAQQLFGGIGFTLDFDIQLYFRRAKQQQLMWANDRVLEDAVAASLLD